VTRIVYQDIDEFAGAMRGTAGCFIRTARSALHWSIEGVDLAHSSMQHLQTGGPFTFAGTGTPGQLTFYMPLTEVGTLRVNGHVLKADSFVVLREGRPFVWTGSRASEWATITVPLSHSLATSVLSSNSDHTGLVRRSSKALPIKVKQLIDGAMHMSGEARRLEAALIDALAQSVPEELPLRIGRPQFSRPVVIARALVLMNSHEGQPLFIDDLCRATQVSERALRNIFREFFGVGPMRLLKARQLHEIRIALLNASPGSATVGQIATRFGAFDPSLLARNYKALFGETPSQTLHRTADDKSNTTHANWLRCASRIFLDASLNWR
jgi:AraC-like DNA-binding protein